MYHDADFGGETQKGEGLCAIVGFWMRSRRRGLGGKVIYAMGR